MSQLDLYTARSIAAERTRAARRDADHRRLARERVQLRTTTTAGVGLGGRLARLHLAPTPGVR